MRGTWVRGGGLIGAMWERSLALPMLGGRPAPPRPHCETAVVLLHGYLCLSARAYWHGLRPVRPALAAAGALVMHVCVPRTGGVAARAGCVARRLATLPYPNLILVGHSMGGLDARYVASRLDPERRIRRVITIGTPHLGSAAAEWALARSPWPAPFLRLIDRGALRDLTRDGAAQLDRAMPDRPDIRYRAVVGRYRAGRWPSPSTRWRPMSVRRRAATTAWSRCGRRRAGRHR